MIPRFQRRRHLNARTALAAAVLAASATTALADNLTWTGGASGNTWSDPANWLNSAGTPGTPANSDNLFFDGTPTVVVNNNDLTGLSINGGTFTASAASFTLNGNSVGLSGQLNDLSPNAQIINLPLILNGSQTVFVDTNGSLTINGQISENGVANLTKTGNGALGLGANNTYTGNTILDGGTLAYNAANTGVKTIIFGAVAGSANTSNLNINANVTATNMLVRTASSTANTINLAPGTTLRTTGGMNLGNNNSTTALSMTGTGNFTMDASTASLLVGGNGATSQTGTLTLGNGTNTITVARMDLGASAGNNGGNTGLILGTGSTMLNIDSMSISTGKSSGTIAFATVGSGSLQIRNTAGTGRANLILAQETNSTTGGTPLGALLLAGNPVDVMLNSLTFSKRSTTAGGENGTITFDTGAFNVNAIDMANRTAGGNVLATIQVGSDNNSTGVFTVNTSFSLANGAQTFGTFDIRGGTANVFCNITQTASTAANDQIVFRGGVLDMHGNNIGASGANGITLNTTNLASTSTIKNLGALNGTGGVVMNGTGTLILDGTNNYTGGTTVNSGTIQLGSGGSGLVTVGTGSITSANPGTALALNRAGVGTIGNAVTGSLAVYHNGPGTSVLTATNTYTGDTNVNNGVLSITGSLSSAGNVLVNTSATSAGVLSSTGSVGNVTLAANNGSNVAGIHPGATGADNAPGTLTMQSLTANGGDLRIDVGADMINVVGNATFNGPTTISPTGGVAGSGPFVILSAGALTLNTTPTVVDPPGRQHFTLDNALLAQNKLALDVIGVAGNLTWTGTVDAGGGIYLWDMGTTANWKNASGVADRFFDGDMVNFTDLGTHKNVTLNTVVNPTSVTISNSTGNDYTINGSGGITGLTGLIKTGAGALVLGGSNTYTGNTTLGGGTLQLLTATALPNGANIVFGTAASPIRLDLNGFSPKIGGLTSGSNPTADIIGNSSTSSPSTLNYAGGASTFAGTIQDTLGGGNQTVAVTVSGGSLALTGANTYTGATTLNGGTLNFASLSNLGAGNAINFGGGALQYASGNTTDISTRAVTLGTGGGIVDTNGNNVSFANSIGNGGAGGLTKAGNGNLSLTQPNNYTGNTTVTGGTLLLTANDILADGAALIVNGGNLDMGANSDTVATVSLINGNILGTNQITGSSFDVRSGTINPAIAGNAALIKSTSGIVTLAGAANYTGATTLDGGTLIFAQDHSGAALTFGAAAGSANPSTLDLTNANFIATTLTDRTDNTSTGTADLILIGDNKTLAINGSVTVGTTLASTSTVLKAKGNGTLAVSGTNPSITIGLTPAGGNSPGTLDLSELGNFTFSTSGTGVLAIGSNGASNPRGTLILANTFNSITAGTVSVADVAATNAGQGTLILGAGTNMINANTITVAAGKSSGTIAFTTATGSLSIRDASGSGRANLDLSDTKTGGSTSATLTSVLNFNGHPVDLLLNVATLGHRSNTSTGGVSVSLSFDNGTLDANQILMAFRSAGGNSNANLTVGGTAHLNVGNSGMVLADGTNATGTLSINDSAVGQINGDINRNGSGVANINLAGTLDLLNLDTGSNNDHNLANSGSPIDNVNMNGGTLQNFASASIGALNGTGKILGGRNGGNTGTLTVGGNTDSTYSGLIDNGTGTLALVKQNSSMFTLAGNSTYTGGTSIQGGTLLTNTNFSNGTLNLQGGTARVAQRPNNNESDHVTLVPAVQFNGGALDLTNNAMIIDYDPLAPQSPLNDVRNAVSNGYSGGNWNGNGINSSTAAASSTPKTAVGYAEASTLHITNFHGYIVDGSAILLAYTANGDANLDGNVNALDFNALATNYGAGSNLWTQGDFNYDGNVDTLDFNALASNFNQSTPPPAAPALGTLVPEPVGLITLLAPLLLVRRRRVQN